MRNWPFFDFADPELGTWTSNHDMFGIVRNYALGALSYAINTFIQQYLVILSICQFDPCAVTFWLRWYNVTHAFCEFIKYLFF